MLVEWWTCGGPGGDAGHKGGGSWRQQLEGEPMPRTAGGTAVRPGWREWLTCQREIMLQGERTTGWGCCWMQHLGQADHPSSAEAQATGNPSHSSTSPAQPRCSPPFQPSKRCLGKAGDLAVGWGWTGQHPAPVQAAPLPAPPALDRHTNITLISTTVSLTPPSPLCRAPQTPS